MFLFDDRENESSFVKYMKVLFTWHLHINCLIFLLLYLIIIHNDIVLKLLIVFLVQTRSKVMQSYVKDLNEQNDVLLSTLDEIEQENDNCVSCLESKLYKATSSAEVYNIAHHS